MKPHTEIIAKDEVTTDTLDPLGRLRDLVNKISGGTSLSDFAILSTGGYDGVGNRLSVTATLNTSYAPASYSGTTSYTYDYASTTASARRSQVTQEASTRGGSYTNTFGERHLRLTVAPYPRRTYCHARLVLSHSLSQCFVPRSERSRTILAGQSSRSTLGSQR